MPLANLTGDKTSRSLSNSGTYVELASVPDTHLRKGTHSGENGGDCVELAAVTGAIAVRDSKDPSGPSSC
ncbi:Domain of uncharacterised function (DUF397) [Mycobacterium tuberculosis]|nr:Domain of uncharacterised function (DUF397) [Mycobacterium tuberculosis]